MYFREAMHIEGLICTQSWVVCVSSRKNSWMYRKSSFSILSVTPCCLAQSALQRGASRWRYCFKWVLNTERQFSMGFKQGLYGGRNLNFNSCVSNYCRKCCNEITECLLRHWTRVDFVMEYSRYCSNHYRVSTMLSTNGAIHMRPTSCPAVRPFGP